MKINKISFGAVKTQIAEPAGNKNKKNAKLSSYNDTFERSYTAPKSGILKNTLAAITLSLGLASAPISTNAQQYRIVTTSDWIVGKTTSDKSVYGLAKRFNMSPEKFSETFDVPLDGVKKGYVFKVPSHKVDNGETLSSIAKMYKMDVALLAQINDIDMKKDAALKPGEYIFILPNKSLKKNGEKQPSEGNSALDYLNKRVYTTSGKKWTVQSLHEHVQTTALENGRPANRPLPLIDKNGRIIAEFNVFEPEGYGKLVNKTIIINTGHGYKANGEFDVGSSNAILAENKAGKIVETTNFTGNGGKALEEWKVNKDLGIEIAKELCKQGAKVAVISGDENLAEKAIRKTDAHMLISLHSNNDTDTGIRILYNIRNGLDKQDKELADIMQNNFESNSRLRGKNEQKGESLDILSASKLKTLDIPAVMIQTGNLRDKKDIQNLTSGFFKKALVQQIENSIVEYFDKN